MSQEHGYATGFKIEGNPQDYLSKEDIEDRGWAQYEESPNGYLYNFQKVSGKHGMARTWRLKFYKHDTYLAPLEVCYYIENDPFVYDGFEGWTEKFSFECRNVEEFDQLLRMLCI